MDVSAARERLAQADNLLAILGHGVDIGRTQYSVLNALNKSKPVPANTFAKSMMLDGDPSEVAAKSRRLRRKHLAQKVIRQWLWFAAPAIGDLRARRYSKHGRLSRCVNVWRGRLQSKRRSWQLAILAGGRLRFVRQRRGLTTWLAAMHGHKAHQQQLIMASNPATLLPSAGRRYLQRWQQRCSDSAVLRRSMKAAISFHKSLLGQRCLRRWRLLVRRSQESALKEARALRHWAALQLRRCIVFWKATVRRRRVINRNLKEMDLWRKQWLLRRTLQHFLDRLSMRLSLKDLSAEGTAHFYRTGASTAFNIWRERARARRRKDPFYTTAVRRVDRWRKQQALFLWRKHVRRRKGDRDRLGDSTLIGRVVVARALRMWNLSAAQWKEYSRAISIGCAAWARRRKQAGLAVWRANCLSRDRRDRAVAIEAAVSAGGVHFSHALQRRGLLVLSAAVRKSSRRKLCRRLAHTFRSHVLQLRYFEAWRCVQTSDLALRKKEHSWITNLQQRCMKKAVQQWRGFLVVAASRRRAARPILMLYMHAWVSIAERKRQKREDRCEAEKCGQRRNVVYAMRVWRAHSVRMRDVRKEAKEKYHKAVQALVCRSLRRWRLVANSVSRKEVSLDLATRHERGRQLSVALSRWQTVSVTSQLQHTASNTADIYIKSTVLKHALHAWRRISASRRARQAAVVVLEYQAREAANSVRMKCALCVWVEAHRHRAVRRVEALRARCHAEAKLEKRVMGAWVAVASVLGRLRRLKRRVVASSLLELQRRVFAGLAQHAHEEKERRGKTVMALQTWKLSTERKVWRGLRWYWEHKKHKRARAEDALVWRRRMFLREGCVAWMEGADSIARSRAVFLSQRQARRAVREFELVHKYAMRWWSKTKESMLKRAAQATSVGISGQTQPHSLFSSHKPMDWHERWRLSAGHNVNDVQQRPRDVPVPSRVTTTPIPSPPQTQPPIPTARAPLTHDSVASTSSLADNNTIRSSIRSGANVARRPPPRRPIELLLEQDNGDSSPGGAFRIPPWVLKEMDNRHPRAESAQNGLHSGHISQPSYASSPAYSRSPYQESIHTTSAPPTTSPHSQTQKGSRVPHEQVSVLSSFAHATRGSEESGFSHTPSTPSAESVSGSRVYSTYNRHVAMPSAAPLSYMRPLSTSVSNTTGDTTAGSAHVSTHSHGAAFIETETIHAENPPHPIHAQPPASIVSSSPHMTSTAPGGLDLDTATIQPSTSHERVNRSPGRNVGSTSTAHVPESSSSDTHQNDSQSDTQIDGSHVSDLNIVSSRERVNSSPGRHVVSTSTVRVSESSARDTHESKDSHVSDLDVVLKEEAAREEEQQRIQAENALREMEGLLEEWQVRKVQHASNSLLQKALSMSISVSSGEVEHTQNVSKELHAIRANMREYAEWKARATGELTRLKSQAEMLVTAVR